MNDQAPEQTERDPLEQIRVRHKDAPDDAPTGTVPYQALAHWQSKGFVEVPTESPEDQAAIQSPQAQAEITEDRAADNADAAEPGEAAAVDPEPLDTDEATEAPKVQSPDPRGRGKQRGTGTAADSADSTTK
jgi:hypothetical protein